MRALVVSTWLLLGALIAVQVESREARDRLSANGLELYSWRDPKIGLWRFVLMPRVARERTDAEIFSATPAIGSVSALKERLMMLAENEEVWWFNRHSPEFTVPEDKIVREIIDCAATAKVRVHPIFVVATSNNRLQRTGDG